MGMVSVGRPVRGKLSETDLLQPLQGLTKVAVREALREFKVSEVFLQAVM